MSPNENAQLTREIVFHQSKLKELVDNARTDYERLRQVVTWRKGLAFVFRGIFVLGGSAIGFGLPGDWPRIVGAMVALVGIVDNQWLFNHEILMFTTPARNAYQRLLEAVAEEFTEAFRPLGPDEERASHELNALLENIKRARRALFAGDRNIKNARENKELGVLRKLAIQPDMSPQSQEQKHQSGSKSPDEGNSVPDTR